jgi:predicted AAA+ superfamily ATPase
MQNALSLPIISIENVIYFTFLALNMLFLDPMEIKRTLIQALINWKYNPKSKPLVLQGARQTGKT